MKPTLIGYFPKKTLRELDWLEADHVEEICSASECLSEGPPDWVEAWAHNARWLFNSPEIGWRVAGDERQEHEMYAFAQYPIQVDEGAVIPDPVSICGVSRLPEGFELLGYDAVSRSGGNRFECSPLSCNHAARDFPCNSRCLFDTLDEAIEAAKEFSLSSGGWEPGPYHVVAVYREKR